MLKPLSSVEFLEVYSKFRRFTSRPIVENVINEAIREQLLLQRRQVHPLTIELTTDSEIVGVGRMIFNDVGGFRELINNLDILITCTREIRYANFSYGEDNSYTMERIYKYLKASGNMEDNSYVLIDEGTVRKLDIIIPDEYILSAANSKLLIKVDDYLKNINKIAKVGHTFIPFRPNLISILSSIGCYLHDLPRQDFPECF